MIAEEFDTTPNKAIRQMLEETIMPQREITGGRISVDVDDEVAETLRSLKLYSTESDGAVLLRLLIEWKRKW